MKDLISDKDARSDFRYIAKALNGECDLDPEEWRKSRRALVSLIRRKLGDQETPELPDGVFSCTSGMMIGCGNGRDQFGAGKGSTPTQRTRHTDS
jgi:hypothetical protein